MKGRNICIYIYSQWPLLLVHVLHWSFKAWCFLNRVGIEFWAQKQQKLPYCFHLSGHFVSDDKFMLQPTVMGFHCPLLWLNGPQNTNTLYPYIYFPYTAIFQNLSILLIKCYFSCVITYLKLVLKDN